MVVKLTNTDRVINYFASADNIFNFHYYSAMKFNHFIVTATAVAGL